MIGVRCNYRVEHGQGFGVAVPEFKQISTGIHLQGRREAVFFNIIAYQQRKLHGIVGNQFGGSCFQYIQLRLRPAKLADIKRKPRVP